MFIRKLEKLIWWTSEAVDSPLDKLTSYRLVLYSLIADLSVGLIISLGHGLPFTWYELAASTAWLLLVCRLANLGLSRWLNVPSNKESDLISALILSLIMNPAANLHGYLVLALAGLAAMSSKYLLTIGQRHIFNPAALGAVISGLVVGEYASWWVGTVGLLPIVLVSGLLILRKMKRFTMAAAFLAASLVVIGFTFHQPIDNFHYLLTHSALIFFTSVMLIEPMSAPTRRLNYLAMAVLVGAAYNLGKLGLAPEEALLIGNALGFLLEPNLRAKLFFVGAQPETPGVYSFFFRPAKKFSFKAGQYLELTLPQAEADSRGNRRYLTIASAPSENEIAFSVRIPSRPSTFKQQLAKLKPGDYLLASQLAGSFILPINSQQKLAFIAGGIGITPFRSIIKQLAIEGNARAINLFYLAQTANDFSFKDTFDSARSIGIATQYLVTGQNGRLNPEFIKQTMPDFNERLFYISGPYGMVKSIRESLVELGVSWRHIKVDYFPGYS